MKKYLVPAILLCVHLFLLANLQFTAWPEIFSFTYLKNNGYLLYRDMVHAYPPLLTLVLAAVFKIFGYKLMILKAITWLGILINDILILLIIKKITKSFFLAVVYLALYVVIQPVLEGNMLWYDTAIVTPILLGTLFGLNSLKKADKKTIILAGLFFGIASLIKQTGAFYYLGFLIIFILRNKKLELIKYYFVTPVILWSILIARLITENTLMGFLNSVFINPSQYWTQFPYYIDLDLNNYEIRILLLLLLPIFGLIPLIIKKQTNKLISLFLVLSIIAVYPRFSFFHFQAAIAFIFISLAILTKKFGFKYMLVSLFIVSGILYFSRYQINWGSEVRFFEKNNLAIADEVTNIVPEGETVYLLGLHSHLYTLTHHLPPKPWSDNFGWHYEVPGFEEYVVDQWTNNPPTYVFWNMSDMFQPQLITEWITKNYNRETKLSSNIEIWKIKN